MSTASRELVGQSLMLSFPGGEPAPAFAGLLARTRPCGVILFAQDIAGPEQLRQLCDWLQNQAASHGLPPLLIGIDQEGGLVSRLPAPFVVPPGQQAQGVAGPEAAYRAAQISGAQLRACGVNLNFAPVIDINNNPANPVIGVRSFGADPATVSACGLAALRGYHETGVIATVKHFPGHGDTTVDSHHGLPLVTHGPERLEAIELAPFRAAIAAGAPAVMAAHVIYAALDTEPATLSPAILRGLLRERMGFAGLVFTDALDMRAIAERHPAPAAAVLARAAGADIVIPLGDAANQIAVADALVGALEDGTLAEADVVATVVRLERLREAYALGSGASGGEPWRTSEAAALELARRGMTRRDPGGLLPLARHTKLAVLDCLVPRFNNAEEAAARSELLHGLLAAAFPALRYRALPHAAPDELWAQAAEAAAGAEAVLLVTRNAWALERQSALGAALAARPAPLIHLAARSPHDCEHIAGASASLCIYGDPPLALRAAVEALSGQ